MIAQKGPCPVPLYTLADGFLGGHNGGRACTFIVSLLPPEERASACSQKQYACDECPFHHQLRRQFPHSFNPGVFEKFLQHTHSRPVALA
ncbi:MAG: hypothetical protein HQM06_15435 [Magnetococcales bacterium]|nr:hypothetical protein [Magnetococcales bacterium]